MGFPVLDHPSLNALCHSSRLSLALWVGNPKSQPSALGLFLLPFLFLSVVDHLRGQSAKEEMEFEQLVFRLLNLHTCTVLAFLVLNSFRSNQNLLPTISLRWRTMKMETNSSAPGTRSPSPGSKMELATHFHLLNSILMQGTQKEGLNRNRRARRRDIFRAVSLWSNPNILESEI
jgi:hypothetical protein